MSGIPGAEYTDAALRCLDCGWTSSATGADGFRRLRARARYHARKWPHTVRVVVALVREYRGEL